MLARLQGGRLDGETLNLPNPPPSVLKLPVFGKTHPEEYRLLFYNDYIARYIVWSMF